MKKIKNLLMVVFGLKPKSNSSRDVDNERRLYLSSLYFLNKISFEEYFSERFEISRKTGEPYEDFILVMLVNIHRKRLDW
jgi:hypothetical protein